MKVTSFTDYALRVLMYLAVRPEQLATISGISRAFDVKENHLSKVVHYLGKQGFIVTSRGKGGGLRLARKPSEIVIGDLVRRTEGDAAPVDCMPRQGPACCIAPVCRLGTAMQEAMNAFFRVLDGYTLEDITANRAELAPILFLEPAAH